MRPHHLQMLQHSKITIHKSVHAVRRAGILFTRQLTRGYTASDTFLEAGFREFMDC